MKGEREDSSSTNSLTLISQPCLCRTCISWITAHVESPLWSLLFVFFCFLTLISQILSKLKQFHQSQRIRLLYRVDWIKIWFCFFPDKHNKSKLTFAWHNFAMRWNYTGHEKYNISAVSIIIIIFLKFRHFCKIMQSLEFQTPSD